MPTDEREGWTWYVNLDTKRGTIDQAGPYATEEAAERVAADFMATGLYEAARAVMVIES